MPTLNDALRSIERHLGFPTSRSQTVARRLQEAEILPSGAPGIAPELEVEHVVDLIIALAADTTLHKSADAVRQYRALTPGGANLEGAPESITRNAGAALDILAEIAVRGESDSLRRDLIEVVANWGEIAIQTANTVMRFVPLGANAGHWRESGHRRATTIGGAAFVDTFRELFREAA